MTESEDQDPRLIAQEVYHMPGTNRMKSHFAYQIGLLRRRAGRTTLEKVLIPAAALLFGACIVLGGMYVMERNLSDSAKNTTVTAESTAGTNDSSDNTKDSSSAQVTTKAADSSASASAGTSTAAASSETAAAVITNPSSMYSSYADMVSFDPATGWAQFDYFNLLQGADAVKYLVDVKGYTQADAEAEVGDYADSEFINQNDNPQLRTADMSSVQIGMLYNPDGSQTASWADVDTKTYDEFKALYAAHPDQVLTESSFFYYVTVQGGIITKVTQVYWP